jgi:dephospho-CoA kinase
MIRAGLTGGIATGKSYCAARFKGLGVPVIEADRLARDAVAPGSPGLAAVVARFGPSVLQGDGRSLDRSALGRIVFADRTARADLEAIIHPEVYQRIREWFANLPAGTRLAVADIPLLFETGHQHDFDAVVVAACAPEVQVQRVMDRDQLSEPDARARVAAQWPIDDKVARADYVIRTDGSFAETDERVRKLAETLSAAK